MAILPAGTADRVSARVQLLDVHMEFDSLQSKLALVGQSEQTLRKGKPPPPRPHRFVGEEPQHLFTGF